MTRRCFLNLAHISLLTFVFIYCNSPLGLVAQVSEAETINTEKMSVEEILEKYKELKVKREIPESSETPAKIEMGTKTSKLAPNFQLKDIYQNTYTLSSYKDKDNLLLFFWTTWCPFCERELKVLSDKYGGLVEDGLEVLAINVGELSRDVYNFVKDLFLPYRILLDEDTSVSNSYGIIGVPTYIIVNKEGYVVFGNNYFPQKEYKDLISK